MKKLLRSNDSEQLRLFAGLCRDKLDEFDRSLELYRRVLNLQEDTHGSDHEEMAATYLSIGIALGKFYISFVNDVVWGFVSFHFVKLRICEI